MFRQHIFHRIGLQKIVSSKYFFSNDINTNNLRQIFGVSTSRFGRIEEKALKIKIKETSQIGDIIDNIFMPEDINGRLKEMYLPDFDNTKILTYSSDKYPNLSSYQSKFLFKLRLLMLNNLPETELPNCERFIDDFAAYLYDIVGFDDGKDLIMQPCNLRLKICDEEFAAHADKEGRRGAEITWVLCEDKHRKSSTYKKGDIQLASCMIAAFQENYNLLDTIYPQKIIGMKIIADRFYFYSMNISETYLNDLYSKLPEDNVELIKYSSDGLSIADPKQRQEIFKYLTAMKEYALNLEPKKIKNL